jgi:PleD family two-component response regulator
MHQIAGLHARAQQGGSGYVVLMVDIDHFKAINDQHGHAEGDKVLKRVAQSLRENLRPEDVVARWGGEEFCVLLPRVALAEAQQIAASGTPRVTVSIGMAEVHAVSEEPDGVIRRADGALYQAKQAGRNRVMSAASLVQA